jgi:hypothetical protein
LWIKHTGRALLYPANVGRTPSSAFLGTVAALHAHGELSDVEAIGATRRALQFRLNAEEAARTAAERKAAFNRPQIAGPVSEPAPPPAAPPAGAADITKGWTLNPIEDAIAEQERAAVAERKANYPLPEKPAPAPPAAAEAQQPQTAAPSEGAQACATMARLTISSASRWGSTPISICSLPRRARPSR